jgi:hypothetical protein
MSPSARHLLEEALDINEACEHGVHLRTDELAAGTATNAILWSEVRA